jgi:hypothetical protein
VELEFNARKTMATMLKAYRPDLWDLNQSGDVDNEFAFLDHIVSMHAGRFTVGITRQALLSRSAPLPNITNFK